MIFFLKLFLNPRQSLRVPLSGILKERKKNWKHQWVWFGMLLSTRNFIGFGQNSTHLLLDNRLIAHSAITWNSCLFNVCEHIA